MGTLNLCLEKTDAMQKDLVQSEHPEKTSKQAGLGVPHSRFKIKDNHKTLSIHYQDTPGSEGV